MDIPRKPNQGNAIGLARLAPGSDVGLAGIGLTAKVSAQFDAEGKSTSNNIVEIWITMALAQPSPIDGLLHIEEIPYRMIGAAVAPALIEKFNEMKAARLQSAPSLIVP